MQTTNSGDCKLKFRFYDKDHEYLYFTFHDLLNDIGEGGGLQIYSDLYNNLDKVEQFTGLTDKNGREIYEGDIVSDVATEGKLKVFYSESSAAFGLMGIDGFLDGRTTRLSDGSLGELEIIGNIRENPSLLKSNYKESEPK